jgi:dipeptidyl aminopeptidase/acylaminoacyl peptidase
LVTVGDPAVSPDGATVAVTVTRIDVGANRHRSAVWLVPADGGRPRPLTSGSESDGGARWSPDGERIAFVRSTGPAEDPPQSTVLVMPVEGPGEAVEVASSREAITDLDWSPDGERLAWVTRVPAVEHGIKDRDREPRRIDTLLTRLDDVGWVVDRPQHVFVGRIDTTEAPRQVTFGPRPNRSPRWRPDGCSLLVTAALHEDWDLDLAEDLFLLDVDADPEEGAPRRLTDSTVIWMHPSWSPDGSRVAALVDDPRTGFRNPRPLVLDIESGSTVDVAPNVDRSFIAYPGARPPVWLDDRSLLVSYEDSGRVGVVRAAADGASEPVEVAGGDRWALGYDAAGPTLAVVWSDLALLPELSILPLAGGDVDAAARTSFGAAFHRACPSLPVEQFAVPSPAGDGDIDAWFVAPDPAAVDGDRWPLILSIHGGPMTQYGHRWFDEWQLWASAGFAVVGCNPHGSSGRDNAWARAIRSPLAELDPGTGWGGIDADDILAVLDATLERWQEADSARVGVHGGSYGGFMTSWLLARTDRFAAGCSERAVNNLLSEEWSSDVGGWFRAELGVSHLEHADEYLRMSPASYASDITAPILIIHSESDLRCHIEQADALFVALRQLRHPDVEYWRFPGESHELSRSGAPKHRIRRAELIVDFFTRTLAKPT